VRQLIEHYQVYFVCDAPTHQWDSYAAVLAWLNNFIGVPAWDHVVFTNRRSLLYGDYLVEGQDTKNPMSTRIAFGSDTFKTWEDVTDYFALLGGQ